MTNCPCQSGKTFKTCCEPILNGETAATALALMRSRYTAYKTINAAYLLKTQHPNAKMYSTISEIEQWAKENDWIKLEIIGSEKGKSFDERGTVEFKAHFIDKHGKHQIHHENSTFIKENGKWFYLNGIANPKKMNLKEKISRNDPCTCGSGKKYKKCCG